MKYGCIGEHLSHSFSKEIHNALADYEYGICEVERERLDEFMTKRDFSAINVTIPYKELVIPHMFYTDPRAKAIGAVNTVVNKDGRLYGYNTDFFGMESLLRHAKIDMLGKKVLILGTGGTSKTARSVAGYSGARETITVSRTARNGAVSYDDACKFHTDADIIINTTPVGMFPDIYKTPIDLGYFKSLSGVIDAIYNPLRSELIAEAERRGIKAEGGLYMLVAQAVEASGYFLGKKHPDEKLNRVYKKILGEKENIVLTGMPASGKSTVGKILADRLSRRFIDTDAMIEARAGTCISEIFKKHGEEYFRELESEAIKEASALTSAVIATGGGAVLKSENVSALKKNGRIYFIDRPLEALMPTEDRPLALTKEAIKKRYDERYKTYLFTADERIDASLDAEAVARKITEVK